MKTIKLTKKSVMVNYPKYSTALPVYLIKAQRLAKIKASQKRLAKLEQLVKPLHKRTYAKYAIWTPEAIESIGSAIGFKAMHTKYMRSGLPLFNPFNVQNDSHLKDFKSNATTALCEAVINLNLMGCDIATSEEPFIAGYKSSNELERYAKKTYRHVFNEVWGETEQQYNIVDVTKQIQSEFVLENNELLKALKPLYSTIEWYVIKRIAEGNTYETIGKHLQKIIDSEKTLFAVKWKKSTGKICRVWIASKSEQSAIRAVARKQNNIGCFVSIESMTSGSTSYYYSKVRRIHQKCIRKALRYKAEHPELFE